MKRILIPTVLAMALVAIMVMGSAVAVANNGQSHNSWQQLATVTAYSSTTASTSTSSSCSVPEASSDSECVASSHGVSVALSQQGVSHRRSINMSRSDTSETTVNVSGLLETTSASLGISSTAAEVFEGSSMGIALGHGKGVAKATANGQLDYTMEYGNSKSGRVTTRTETEKVSASAKAKASATDVAEDSNSRNGRPKCDVDRSNDSDQGWITLRSKTVTFLIKVEAKAYVKACADADADAGEGEASASAFGGSESWALAKLEVYYKDSGPVYRSDNGDNGRDKKEVERDLRKALEDALDWD